jgi:Domain of unknown function (DUF1877)
MDAYLVRVSASESSDILASADAVSKVIAGASNDSERKLDLDEAWAGLHFVLTAEVPIPKQEALRLGLSWYDDSLENVLMGGEPTKYRDSFGVARYLSAEEVARMTDKLSDLSVERFKGFYDADGLIEYDIPPAIWEDQLESRDWLARYYYQLVDFFRSAAFSGDGVMIYFI